MTENPRIDELRRRLDKDPASIAFAELAEELRRAQRLPEAVQTCRLGLARNPGFLAARVTLGRCLMALNDLVSARAELEQVRRVAPANLGGLEGLVDVYERLGLAAEARECAERIDELSGRARDLRANVAAVMRQVDTFTAPVEVLAPAAPPASATPLNRNLQVVKALEQFLAAVHAARVRRGAA
jgi:predicted Zn-dependent protease